MSSKAGSQASPNTTRSDSRGSSPQSSHGTFSPAVIAVIGILAAAFLLVSYYTMVAKFCSSRQRGHGFFRRSRRLRRRNTNLNNFLLDMVGNGEQIVWPSFPQRGLSDGEIESLPVIEYRKRSSLSSSDRRGCCMARSMAEDVTRNKQGKEVDRDAASTRDCASSLGSNSIVDGEQKSAMGMLWTSEGGKLAMETSTAVGSRGGKVTMEMLLEAGKMDMETVRGDRIDEDDDEDNGDDKDKDMDMAAMSSDDKKSDWHLFYDPIVVLCGSSDCAVCLCEFEDGEMVRVLPRCGHGFHLECIYMWLHSHPNCPVCRTHVLLPDPEPSSPEASDAALLPPLPPLQHQDPVHDLQPFHVPDEGEAEDINDGQQLVWGAPRNCEQRPVKEKRGPLIFAEQMGNGNALQPGLGFRCFSAGRASMSRFAVTHDDDEFQDCRDDVERGTIGRSRSLVFQVGHDRHLDGQAQDWADAMVDMKKLVTSLSVSSSLVPSSSSAPSSLVPSSSSLPPSSSVVLVTVSEANDHENTVRDLKSKSFNSDDEEEMKSLGSEAFTAMMAHSLRCSRVVRRTFSGGKLFSFRGQHRSTSSSSSIISEAIPPQLPI